MSKEVVLSRRLKTLTEKVTPGNRVADVGCDHGFVSIYLVQKGISPNVIAMDVRTGPLQRAKEHVTMYGLEKEIQTRLSDGLDAFKVGEAETLIVAGMGGKLMSEIIAKHMDRSKSFRELILQPQSELPEFRVFLRDNGFSVVEEDMLLEEGKYYFIFKVVPGTEETVEDEALLKLYDRYGKRLLLEAHPVAKDYLLYRKGVLKDIAKNLEGQGHERSVERHAQVLSEIKEIESVLSTFFK